MDKTSAMSELEYNINSIIYKARQEEKIKHAPDYEESKYKQNTVKCLEMQINAKKYKILKLFNILF